MHQYEVWIDLECPSGDSQEVVCTIFAQLAFPVPLAVGESFTLWSAQESPVNFNVVTAMGVQQVNYVDTFVDEVAHHVRPDAGAQTVSTSIRCRPLLLATAADARIAVSFLSAQHHFELDPYAVNKLDAT
jgi:hypothetical protein